MDASSKSKVFLKSPSNWDSWILVTRTIARGGDVDLWPYINPGLDSLQIAPYPVAPELPTIRSVKADATRIADLDAAERDILKLELAYYKEANSEVQGLFRLAKQVSDWLVESVDVEYHNLFKNASTPYEALVALKKRLAPSDRARKEELSRRYNSLKHYTKTEKIENWLQRWERTYIPCKELDLPETFDQRPQFDFLMALKPIDAAYSAGYELRLNSKITKHSLSAPEKIPSLFDIVEDFRNHWRLMEVSRSGNAAGVQAGAFGGTFGGQTQQQNPSSGSSRSSTSPPFCKIDGINHYYRDCPYVSEQARPNGWKPRQEILDKFDKLLATDNYFRGKIENVRARAGKAKSSTQPTSQISSDSTQNQNRGSFATISIKNTDSDDYPLRQCTILDSGTDIHVCNDQSSFQFQRRAGPDDVLHAGMDSYKIQAFGTVDVPIQTPDGQMSITLLDVAFVPGYLASLVAASKLSAKGVHIDSENRRLQRKGDTFCYYFEIGGHWVLDGPQVRKFTPAPPEPTITPPPSPPATQHTAKERHLTSGHPITTEYQELVQLLDLPDLDATASPTHSEIDLLLVSSVDNLLEETVVVGNQNNQQQNLNFQANTQFLTPSQTDSTDLILNSDSDSTVQVKQDPVQRCQELSSDISDSNILPSRTRTRRKAHDFPVQNDHLLPGSHMDSSTLTLQELEQIHRENLPPERPDKRA